MSSKKLQRMFGLYILITCFSFIGFFTQFPWLKHVNHLFSPETIKAEEEIIVPTLPYLKKMTKIIKKTPKRFEINKLRSGITKFYGIVNWT